MSRTTNSILLRYGITVFWASSFYTQKQSNIYLQLNSLLQLILRNYFLKLLRMQHIYSHLILYVFTFKIEKLSFLKKYLIFLKKKNNSKLRKIYGITALNKKKKKKINKLQYLTYLKIQCNINLLKIKYNKKIPKSVTTLLTKKIFYVRQKHRKKLMSFFKIKLLKLNHLIKIKLLELFIVFAIAFYSKKQYTIKINLITEKIQNIKLPFFFKIITDNESKQRFFIILLSFMFFNSSILTSYLNNVIKNVKDKKHVHILTFFFKKVNTLFLQQIIPLSGLKFKIAGRLNGKLRKSRFGYTLGSVKLMTFNLHFNYSYECVYTQYGVFSLKLWLSEWNQKKKYLNIQ